MNTIIVRHDQMYPYSTLRPVPKGQVQFSKVGFLFSEEWANRDKIAQFLQGDTAYNVPLEDNECFIPYELDIGYATLYVKGYDNSGASIATANGVILEIVQGFMEDGEPPVPPTPDLYQRLLESIGEANEHPPIPGENGFWLIWDTTLDEYKESEIPLPAVKEFIKSMEFNPEKGRWEIHYTTGEVESFAGFDPSDDGIYSIFRENFESYEIGPDAFGLPGTETPDWRLSDTHVKGVRYGIGQEDNDNKYALLECDDGKNDNGAENRAAFTVEHEMQGKFVIQFDYMPLSDERAVSGWLAMTDFFEIWPFGTTDQRFRVRINCLGDSYVHVVAGTGISSSGKMLKENGDSFTFYHKKWHRIKITVEEGRIAVKAWKLTQPTTPEPEKGDLSYGFTELKADIFSKEYLNNPHEIRFVYGPMVGGEPTAEHKWNMGFDNLKVYRVHEGKQGPQGIQGPIGPTGPQGRGISTVSFNNSTGRWEIRYTDKTFQSFEGYDPIESSIWSIFRDDFNTTSILDGTDWKQGPIKMGDSFFGGVSGTDFNYVTFNAKGASGRISATIAHPFSGEYTMEFDYMPTYPGSVTPEKTVTDFFEVWLLSHESVAGPIRARINLKGRHAIHVNRNYTTETSDVYMNNLILTAKTWYRIKISVKVGKVAMKIWQRGGIEPIEGDSGTVVLKSDVITEEIIDRSRELSFVYGSMGAESPAGDGYWTVGFDSVRIYRNLLGDIDAALDGIIALQNSYIGGDT